MLVLRGIQDDDGARRAHEPDDKVLAGRGGRLPGRNAWANARLQAGQL